MKFFIVLAALCLSQAYGQDQELDELFPIIRCVENNRVAVQIQSAVYPGAIQACIDSVVPGGGTLPADLPTIAAAVRTTLTNLNTLLTTFANIPAIQTIRRRQAALAAISGAATVGPSADQLVISSSAVTNPPANFLTCVSTAVNNLKAAVQVLAACN